MKKTPTTSTRRAWEQLRGEPDPAFAAFRAYLSQEPVGGKRSLVPVAQEVGRPLLWCESCARNFGWAERARLFDAEEREPTTVDRLHGVMGSVVGRHVARAIKDFEGDEELAPDARARIALGIARALDWMHRRGM